MGVILKIYISCLLFCVLSIYSKGQGPLIRNFSYQDGLSTYNIRKVLQDQHGLMWVATQDGLYRYDGVEFEKFHAGSAPLKLSGNSILDIALKDSFLIVSVYNKGIDILNTNTLERVAVINPQNLTGLSSKLFSINTEGSIMLGSEKGITNVRFYLGKPFLRHLSEIKNDIPGEELIQNDSAIWVSKNESWLYLIRISPQKLKVLDSLFYSNGIKKILKQNERIIIVGNDEVFFTKESNGRIQPLMRLGLSPFKTEKILFGGISNHDLVLITTKRILIFDEDGQCKKVYDNIFLQGNIQHVFVDQSQDLWISTSQHLVFISSELSVFRAFSVDRIRGERLNHIYTLYSVDSLTMLVCGKEGFFKVGLSNGSIFCIPNSKKMGTSHDVFKLAKNEYIVSTDAGLALYNDLNGAFSIGNLINKYPELKEVKDIIVNANYFLGDSIILLGTENEKGLIVWNYKKRSIKKFVHQVGKNGSITSNHVHHIKSDKEGRIWILLDNDICAFDPIQHTFRSLKIVSGFSLNGGFYYDFIDDGHFFWISSYGNGLLRYDKERQTMTALTEEAGLSNSACYGLLQENDSIIWASSNNGLNRINMNSLVMQNYYIEDGLHDNAFDEKSAAADQRYLYFGGVNGFTRVQKNSTMAYEVAQNARIKCIELINDRNERLRYYDFSKIANISSNIVQIRAYGSIHDYSKAHKLHSEYRINDGPWLKTETGHQVIINNPSKGELNLEFRYKTFGKSGSSSAVKFNTYIEPKWYQTTWFRIALLLLVVANAIWITRLYFKRRLMAQQKEIEKQQALQSQRDRISIDMHDDLGSGLSSIKMISEMLKRKHQDEETKTDLNQIVDEASELTATMRDLVWSLNPRNDTILGFADHARRFVKQYFERADIEVHFQMNIAENDLAMHGLARRNLLMILKETCTNIYKYACTTKVNIQLLFRNDTLLITIQDHGKGLAPDVRENNGFYSMRKRVQEIGGSIHWYSDINGLNTVVEWTLA